MSIFYPQVFILLIALFFLVKKSRLLALSLAIMILSFSRPVLSEVMQKEDYLTKEFIIALDVSYSMRAEDIQPSRLEKSKTIIKQILKENPQARFTLFAFTTNPLILCPSTSDHQLVLAALHSLNVDDILTHGTSLQKLFERINQLNMPEKNLILLSDGGEEKSVETFDINLFTVAMASQKGSLLKDKYGKTIKDEKGHLLITKQNPLLKKISTKLYAHDSVNFSLDFVKEQTHSKQKQQGYYELFWLPLLLSLILFFMHYVKIPKKLLLLFPFLTLQSDAGLLDWYYLKQAQISYHDKHYKEAVVNYEKVEHKTMQSQMNLANAYYQAAAYTKAKMIYNTLKSSNPTFKKTLLFKLGNCAVKLEDYETARGYYHDALAFGKDMDILHNLKLIADKKAPDNHQPEKSGNEKEKVKSDKSSVNAKESQSGEDGSAPSKLSRPLGFKAYERINKGYIDEKKPW